MHKSQSTIPNDGDEEIGERGRGKEEPASERANKQALEFREFGFLLCSFLFFIFYFFIFYFFIFLFFAEREGRDKSVVTVPYLIKR